MGDGSHENWHLKPCKMTLTMIPFDGWHRIIRSVALMSVTVSCLGMTDLKFSLQICVIKTCDINEPTLGKNLVAHPSKLQFSGTVPRESGGASRVVACPSCRHEGCDSVGSARSKHQDVFDLISDDELPFPDLCMDLCTAYTHTR